MRVSFAIDYSGDPVERAGSQPPLGQQLALYQIGFRARRGERLDMDADLIALGTDFYDFVHANRNAGTITSDAVRYGLGRWKGKDIEAPWLTNITWVKKDGVYIPKRTGSTVEHKARLRPSGFVLATNDGLSHPAGYPFATDPDWNRAVQSRTRRGYSEEEAETETSYWWRRDVMEGDAAVVRWFNDARDGPCDVYAFYVPDFASGGIGALVARGLRAERAEPLLSKADRRLAAAGMASVLRLVRSGA